MPSPSSDLEIQFAQAYRPAFGNEGMPFPGLDACPWPGYCKHTVNSVNCGPRPEV